MYIGLKAPSGPNAGKQTQAPSLPWVFFFGVTVNMSSSSPLLTSSHTTHQQI